MKLAYEGRKILTGAAVLAVLATILTMLFTLPALKIITGVILFFLLFSAYFFRDPERTFPDDSQLIISPADGKIVRIQKIDDPDVGKSATLVSIFLNVFNVHVNRMPVSGKFEVVNYRKGKFLAAFDHKASDENERTDIVISSNGYRIRLKQIAGLIARRIHCYAEKGAEMDKGARLGFIQFGSRTDLVLPESVTIKVVLDQKVVGNETVIGEFK